MSRNARAALAVAAVIAAAALTLGAAGAALLGVGLLAGMLAERRRLGLALPSPAWPVAAIRRTVGWPAVAAAGTALAVAVALLGVGLGRSGTGERVGRVSAEHAPARPPPPLRTRVERADRSFRVAGVSYRVALDRTAPWAREIRRNRPGRGWRWVTVAVHARALARAGFDPMRLAYRLTTSQRIAYVGAFRGGTGPRSLATRGALRRGQAALVQLGFRVREQARGLALVFEDPGTDAQLRVPLP